MGAGRRTRVTTALAGVAAAAALGTAGQLVASSPAHAAALPSQAISTQAITTATTPTLDPSFMVPPSPLPAGNPGDVIRSRKVPSGPSPTQAIADAWQVMYLSTDALGKPDAVTGTVLVPKGKDLSTAPVVGFGPGTEGISARCAPSLMIADGSFYEQPAVTSMLRKGWAVAVPDYEGYHPDPAATYMTGKSMGPALLDGIRAAQRLPEAGIPDDGPVVIRGYSQGGAAALWAAELQPTYAPSMKLKGVAAGGVPGNLSQVALGLNGTAGFGLMAIALIGLDNAFPELGLAKYLNPAGVEAFASMESGKCVLDLLTDFAGKSLSDYTTSNPLSQLPWLIRVSESTLGSTKVTVPVLQYHATTDGLVAFGQADSLHNTYCQKGVQLAWKTYDTSALGTTAASHIAPISWANDDVLSYLSDRLAGSPAPTTC